MNTIVTPRRLLARALSLVAVCMLLPIPGTALAAWQANPPGMTEVIACATNGSFSPIQWVVDSNDFGFRWFDSLNLGGDPYWNYAVPGNVGFCRNWVRGSIAGGAGYVPGQTSTPKGRNAHISTYWYDYNWPDFYDRRQCGHQHVFTYVWGWRYYRSLLGGGYWTIEFVGSTGRSTYWNAATQHCDLRGDGNPDYTGVPGFAYGDGVVTINNSPYAVLYTMSQAQSHGGGPCGQFGCYHRILVISSFY